MSIAYIQERKYLFLFVFIIFCMLMYKIQHTFLYHSTLPVFKQYEIWKWLKKPTIIVNKFEETSKFYDPIHVSTVSVTDVENIQQEIKDYCIELRNHFLSKCQQLNYIYHPTLGYISSLHKIGAFMSTCKVNQTVVSRIFSRPLLLCMYREKLESHEEYKIQFNDFICTKPSFRKKQYTQRIIYTHMANICNQSNKANHENKIFIAKYENRLLPLIPFVSYFSYAYNLTFIHGKLEQNDITPVIISKLNKKNIHLYYSFLLYLKKSKLFRVFLHTSIDQMKYLVEQNIILIYVLHHKDTIYAMYVFHNPHMKYKNMNMIECISSVRHSKCDDALFYDTFVYVLKQLRETQYFMLILECVSHNLCLQKSLETDVHSIYSYPVTFNMVNYQQIPYYPKDCFFIL